MSPNDTVPDSGPNDTEPEDAPATAGAATVSTDRVWPPRPSAPDADEPASGAHAKDPDLDWYLDGFRGRPQVVVKRQPESDGSSGAAYDALAAPVKRIDPTTAPKAAVILSPTSTPGRQTAPLPPPAAAASSPTEPAAPPSVPGQNTAPKKRPMLTTMPAARRVLAVKRIVNVTVLVALLIAVSTVLIIVIRGARHASERGGVDLTVSSSAVSVERTSAVLPSTHPTELAPQIEPSLSSVVVVESSDAAPALGDATSPIESTAARPPESVQVVSGRPATAPTAQNPSITREPPSVGPAMSTPSPPAAVGSSTDDPKSDGPRKNDGVRQL